jgi:hypothetical protein
VEKAATYALKHAQLKKIIV